MLHRRIGSGRLRHLPALADIARDRHPFVSIMKSAQVGVSELLVNLCLHAADSGYGGRGNVLFAMPTQNMMDDFAQARFDRAIQDSPYLRSRLQPEPPARKGADSKRLKRVGPGYIYLRGTDSRRQIASVDVDRVFLDEFDQMADGILPLAQKRLASSASPSLWVASAPRYPEAGIDELYRQSDQRHYYLPCPACAVAQALSWEQNVDQERAMVVCRSCRAPMDLLARGQWEAHAPGNSRVHGYHLSRLYSPWADIPAMIAASQATGIFSVQEFHNSDLGQPFSPPGGGLTADELDRCRQEYGFADYAGQPCVAGVDVGVVLHVVIRERVARAAEGNDPRPARLWFAGETTFDQLDSLLARHNVGFCVVDAQPELHSATRFAQGTNTKVALARYDRHDDAHELDTGKPGVYHVNRTQALDELAERFRSGEAHVPQNARELGGRPRHGQGEYYRQLLAPQRRVVRDAHGNPRAEWQEGTKDDHYAHAEVYCMLAATMVPRPIVFDCAPIGIWRPSPWHIG